MIITFAHYKGGTGKTTSCLSIAGWLARAGKRVLVIDLDPQGNATSGLGIDKEFLENHMYHVMNKKKSLKNIILQTDIQNLHIAPTTHELGKTNIAVYKGVDEAEILKNAVDSVKEYYDFILIDTPPVHGHFIINGIVASDRLIVVLDTGVFALEGLATLQQYFGGFLSKFNRDLDIDTVLITRAPGFSFFKKNHALEIRETVKEKLESKVYLIPHSENIYDTHLVGIPISHLKPKSNVGRAYAKVALEILQDSERKIDFKEKFRPVDFDYEKDID